MIYRHYMGASLKPSASVIAAGVVAILGSLLILAGSAMSLFAFLFVTLPAASPGQPPFAKALAIGTMAFTMACSIFGIATGIGLFLLRNWARISAMVWAGISFFFGLIGIPIALFMSIPTPQHSPGLPESFTVGFRMILLVIYGLPLAVGIWWLILFNRNASKEQFAGTAVPVDLSIPQKPRGPLPIKVLAWFYITSAANIFIIPFLPFHMPAMLFGRAFYPPAGTVIFVSSCILVSVAGIGLLKLKPWSYSLTIGLQLFWLASGIIGLLNPNFDSSMASMIAQMYSAMHLPANAYAPMDVLHNMRWFMYIGLLIPIGIVGMLFYYRERFLEAASSATA